MSIRKLFQKLFPTKVKPIAAPIMQPNSTKQFEKTTIGFNTGFSFKNNMESHEEYKEWVKYLKVGTLRFSGGTNSQYYHPNGNGYGIIQKEVVGKAPVAITSLLNWDKEENENYIYNFIRLAKQYPDCKVVVDLNLCTGTVAEALLTLDILKENGVNVYGVEMGNELYFKPYRQYIKDVQEYVQISKNYTYKIKQKYPNVLISVCVGNMVEFDTKEGRENKTYRSWNEFLAKEDFYDRISIHTYIGKEDGNNNCVKLTDQNDEKGFDCYKDILAAKTNNPIGKIVEEANKIFGGTKIWLTEWNCGKPNIHLTNSLLHGMFTLEMLLNLSEYPQVELSHFHNISSQGVAYGTLYRNRNSIHPTAAYYAFLVFSKMDKNMKLREEGDIIIYETENAILFINKTNSSLPLDFSYNTSLVVCGNNLSSTGMFAALKKPKELFISTGIIQKIPKFSFGYAEKSKENTNFTNKTFYI